MPAASAGRERGRLRERERGPVGGVGSEAGLQDGDGECSGEMESMAASDGGRLAADLASSGATLASTNHGS